MAKCYLWQESDFPHFYHNEAVARPLEEAFHEEVTGLVARISEKAAEFTDVLTGEIVANSEIEGVFLDRESVNSSFVHNLSSLKEPEQGAVTLTKMALEHFRDPLTHDLLKSMHRNLLRGSEFPEESIGTYVGDMKIVSGHRLDREYTVVHEGVQKELVDEKMTEFIECYNGYSPNTPLINAVRGHIHFETIHPFCDGNGRIGRSLMLMGLCRDFDNGTPLALSRAFHANLRDYYGQFQTGLDLTETLKSMTPLLIGAVKETGRILDLTAYRTRVVDATENLNARQLKVLHRLIDYELREGFKGGLSNANYQSMANVGDRTALRDLNELCELGVLVKTGKLKGTRYHLNIPAVVDLLEDPLAD